MYPQTDSLALSVLSCPLVKRDHDLLIKVVNRDTPYTVVIQIAPVSTIFLVLSSLSGVSFVVGNQLVVLVNRKESYRFPFLPALQNNRVYLP